MSNRLRPWDRVFIAYLLVESVLVFAGRERLDSWWAYLILHGLMLIGIALLSRSSRLPLLRDGYPVLYIPAIFKLLSVLVPAVHPRTYDEHLLAWDRLLFGGHPGAWLDPLASPLLTEALRACWLSYFLMPFLVAVPLYLRRDKRAYHEAALALSLGWLLSYLGYFAVPALGPGYFPDRIPAPACVHGDGATQVVAQALFSLEGRMHDIFPSGHTIIALTVLWLARRHRLRLWPLLVPLVVGLILGTVYLRYHYGVDVAAGAAVFLFVALVTPRIAGSTSR